MAKLLYLKDNCGYWLEMKTDLPERWNEEQQAMRDAYNAGKRLHMQRIYKKVCPTCGDTFYTTTPGQIYDTDRCKNKARWKREHAKVICYCEQCGAAFMPVRKDARFCSAQCKQKSYRYRKTAQQRSGVV